MIKHIMMFTFLCGCGAGVAHLDDDGGVEDGGVDEDSGGDVDGGCLGCLEHVPTPESDETMCVPDHECHPYLHGTLCDPTRPPGEEWVSSCGDGICGNCNEDEEECPEDCPPPDWATCAEVESCAVHCASRGLLCVNRCTSPYDGNLYGFESCAEPACQGAPEERLCVGGCDDEPWEGELVRCCCI